MELLKQKIKLWKKHEMGEEMDWGSLQLNQDNTAKIPQRWIYSYYYEGLNILFRVENTLRAFVYSLLKNEYFGEWLNAQVTTDDSNLGTIESIAKKRMNQSKNFGYLNHPVTSPMMYLSSGELIGLILSDTYWQLFKSYFPAKKEIVKIKLDEIGTVRNALAHFRPIRIEDIEVLKQNSIQILSVVNDYMNNMMHSKFDVPTNTKEDWYLNLKNIESSRCKIKLAQSANGQWISIVLSYKSANIKTLSFPNDFRYFTLTKLVTPAILNVCPQIANLITFLSEGYSLIKISDNQLEEPINKDINFTIEIKSIQKNHKLLFDEITNLISIIENETELIQTDNLAKGKLVETVVLHTKKGDKYIDSDGMQCPYTKDCRLEYWQNDLWTNDFITKSCQYPWMPVNISDFEF
jgi:hypothetical protein